MFTGLAIGADTVENIPGLYIWRERDDQIEVIAYADDMAVFVAGKDIYDVHERAGPVREV